MALGTRGKKSDSGRPLLADDDPPPVRMVNPRGASPFLLIGDHAGDAIPSGLGSLGLGEADLARHIACDIGIAALGASLAGTLDAVFIAQAYSRLVVDCNRGPDAADVIAESSDGTTVPGNAGLRPEQRAERFRLIHEPYQAAIEAELARRDEAGRETVLVALHSFTPRMNERDRPWQIGVLHDKGDTRFAMAVLEALKAKGDLVVGDNEPYAMDGIDYTIPRHAFADARPYVELEIRQDLIATPEGAERWAGLLAEILPAAERAGVARRG
jgi:predicted N-formylglutamate amidohydrolase